MNRTAESRHARWTGSVATLLLLVLIALWLVHRGPAGACCGSAGAGSAVGETPAPAAVATPAPSAAKTSGTFAVRIDGDTRVLDGTVADEAAKSRLLDAARTVFGEPNVVDRLTVDAATIAPACANEAEALFAALRTDPPIGIACDAQGAVTLTGRAFSEADKAARERWAHDFFGANTAVVDAIEVAAPPPPATRPQDVHCAARMPAAVTFKTASSRIDAKGRALLDAIVPCLKQGSYEIDGHTDDVGSEDDNLKLSKARAESVRAYMILKGTDADRLTAVGFGEAHPIGDNATPAGRASNRRIEFVRK